MARGNAAFVSFNGGEIGKEVIARTQIENYGATADLLENIFPEAAGPMSKRPGWEFKVELDADTRLRKFQFGLNQKYLLAFGESTLRIIEDGGIVARPAVSSTVTNSGFDSAIGTGWTNISTVAGNATFSGSQARLTGDGTTTTGIRQQVTTSSAGTLHALRIIVAIGPVKFKVGSASGLDDYVSETELRRGIHSLSFTPSGSYWIEIWTSLRRTMLVDSCVVEAAGDLSLPTPWSLLTYSSLRFQQSKDVMYIAGGGVAQRRIERRSGNSWSIAYTDEQDGPFQTPNIDESVRLNSSVHTGNGTLTCTRNFFSTGQVGALFELTHDEQRVTKTLSGPNQWSEPIKITGVGREGRTFYWGISGTFSGTIQLQESADGLTWNDAAPFWIDGTTATTVGGAFSSVDYIDSGRNRNNQTWFFRIGFSTSGYTSGIAYLTYLFIGSGSQVGVVRATAYISPLQVSIEVLKEIASTGQTPEWREGAWSGEAGYPDALALFDDRLWAGRDDEYWASQSGLYETHASGDDAADAIKRSISTGDVGQIQWILPLSRIVFGTDTAEDVVRSSAFDDPITPTNLTVRDISSWGSADVAPTKVDSRGLFIDRSEIHLMELAYSVDIQDYVARPLTRLHKNIGRPGITQVNVTRRPETRLLAVRTDGQCLLKLYDPGENSLGWSRIITDGDFLSVESLPGAVGEGEDEVYAVIKRRINGVDRYYLEQLGPIYYDTAADASCLDSFVRVDQDECNAVTFNGSVYLLRGADLTGNSDGKAGTFSFWVNIRGTDSAEQVVYASESGYLVVRRTTAGKWQIEGRNAANSIILLMTSATSYTASSGWTHVVFAWDLASGLGKLYVNNASDLAASPTLTNDTIDYTRANHAIGARTGGTLRFTGDLAQIYFARSYLDVSVSTNLRKFISSSRVPVELGATGTGPTGLQPILFLENGFATFGTNLGSGGTFTITTSFLDEADPPATYLAAQTMVVSGLDHLEGQTVTAWADGYDLGEYTVASGAITLSVQPGQVVVGLEYEGRYRSARTAFLNEIGTGQAMQQQLLHINLILSRSSRNIEYGPDFDDMNNVSNYELAIQTDYESGLETGITESLTIPGKMNRDPRLCIRMPGPDPVTVAGYVLSSNAAPRT